MNRPGKCVPSCISLPEASFRKGLKTSTLPSRNDLSEATTTVIILELDSWGMNSGMVYTFTKHYHLYSPFFEAVSSCHLYSKRRFSPWAAKFCFYCGKKKSGRATISMDCSSSIQKVLGSSFTCKHSRKREKSSE